MSSEQPSFSPKTPWQKTTGGIVFLIIISIIITILAVFLLFIAYYGWQIKYGDAEKIATSFNPNFSLASDTVANGLPIERITAPLSQYIQSSNPMRGTEGAPITVVTFIDFECPFSQQSHAIFETVMKRYEPVVKIVFKHFPISAIHPNAVLAAHAAECANEQNKFWEFYQAIFADPTIDEENIRRHVETLGLDMSRFDSCLTSERYTENIEQDIRDGAALGIRGTPTYFLNDLKIEGVIDQTNWDIIMLEELKKLTDEKK